MAITSVDTFVFQPTSRLHRWSQGSLRFARQRPLGAIGAAIVVVMILAAVSAGFIAPFNPVATDYAMMLHAPNSVHWFGTDAFGRDVMSRIIYGSRTALWVGFTSSFLGASLGAIIGVASAYFGGRTDLIVQRFMDLLLSFPLIVLALVVVAVLGTGTSNV
ncbi:MAG: ABC transporter permease, partial [Candidatus Binatia bacterium]|nr:ABC transporter permease [Candidatus Binatia bacterium]